MNNRYARRALVAGGAGFIGSHLCEALLADGMQVICVDSLLTGHRANLANVLNNPGFSFIEADVTLPLPVELVRQPFEEIYNLACAASPPLYQIDPEHTLMTNVIGTRELLTLAARQGARFLLASTSEVYGDPEVHPQDESYRGNVNPIGPRACYDEGKRAAETLAFDFDRAHRAQVRVARIFNTYGPRLAAEDGRVVSNFIVQALAGEPITMYGDGSQTRSFCYISDMVGGLMRLIRHQGAQPGPVNLGNPNEVSITELVHTVTRLTLTASPVVQMPLPVDDPRRRKPDIGRAMRLLGWRPDVSLNEGLRETIAWFEMQMRAPLPALHGARLPERVAAKSP